MRRFDVAVIGAGLGGLTAAALLARAGCRVLVIERSNSVGGAASSYKAGDLFIEGSLHATSDPRDIRDPKHAPLKRAGVLDAVAFVRAPAFYEATGGPLAAPFTTPNGLAAARAALAARFPQHCASIDALFGELIEAASDPGALPGDVSLAARLQTAFGDDEQAKMAVAANLSSLHDDAAALPWRSFALMQGAMLASGPCFIEGGSQRLSSALARVIRRAKGEVLLRRVASAIALDAQGRACGLTHTARDGGDPQSVACGAVIGNAAPGALAAMLPASAAQAFAAAYAARQRSIALFTLTLGLKQPAERFGLTAYWTQLWPDWMTSLARYPEATTLMADEPGARMPALSIANYGAIPAHLPSPPFTISVIGADRRDNWRAPSAAAYRAKRSRWQTALIDHLDRSFAGLKAAVSHASFNTALSVEQYLGATDGAAYGFAPGAPLTIETPVTGLYLASAWAGEGRYNGVIRAASACADAILRAG